MSALHPHHPRTHHAAHTHTLTLSLSLAHTSPSATDAVCTACHFLSTQKGAQASTFQLLLDWHHAQLGTCVLPAIPRQRRSAWVCTSVVTRLCLVCVPRPSPPWQPVAAARSDIHGLRSESGLATLQYVTTFQQACQQECQLLFGCNIEALNLTSSIDTHAQR